MTTPAATIHASAVQVGDIAILIRGASGAGKSRLAFDLMLAGRAGQIAPARLIGDDRVYLEAEDGNAIVRPAPELQGLIEIRGLGIRHCDFIPRAKVGLVVDLEAEDGARLPHAAAQTIVLCGVPLPRIPVPYGYAALPLVIAALVTSPRSMQGTAAFKPLPEGNW